MKKKKQVFVMTSFGPIPFRVIKDYVSINAPKVFSKDTTSEYADNTVPMSVGYYIKSLAIKHGWKPEKMAGYLQTLWELNPSTAFSILLKEIAIELDKKYEDHINSCNEIFIISQMDGRIHKIPRAHIKNFKNFAAFRTEEDAKIACRILRDELKEMFGSARK